MATGHDREKSKARIGSSMLVGSGAVNREGQTVPVQGFAVKRSGRTLAQHMTPAALPGMRSMAAPDQPSLFRRLTMAEYTADLVWVRDGQDFVDNRYSRRHLLRFDGGAEVAASSSPQVVPLPWSDPAAVDPEEAFVASLASCHLLWFLSIAARRGFCVDRYTDRPTGSMAKNAEGKTAMSVVTLRPEVGFSGVRLPTREEVLQLHHLAHAECFIANSVRTEVRCEPVFGTAEA
jgi:organic hydroperoxide reductase OsmC/OhrA